MGRVPMIGRTRLGPAARKALIPGSGLVLLSSATGGMHGDIFQLYVVDTLGYRPSLVSVIAISMVVASRCSCWRRALLAGSGTAV